MPTPSSTLAWRIPGTVEPCGLPAMGSHRVRHDWSDLAAATHPYMTTGKSIALTRRNFFGKVMSLLFNKLSAAAKSLQSCPSLCNPIDGSPPGSLAPGILQARTLEWAAISFSSAWKWKGKVKSLSRVWLFRTAWTAAHQAPPSMGFSHRN